MVPTVEGFAAGLAPVPVAVLGGKALGHLTSLGVRESWLPWLLVSVVAC